MRTKIISLLELTKDLEYHGQRSAYFISTEASLAQMGQSVLGLYETIYQRLVYQYHTRAAVEAAYA